MVIDYNMPHWFLSTEDMAKYDLDYANNKWIKFILLVINGYGKRTSDLLVKEKKEEKIEKYILYYIIYIFS